MTTETRGRRAPSPPPPYPGSTDNAIPYAYGGNRPYQPIGFDVAPGLDGFDYLTPDGTRKHIAFSELVAEDEKSQRSKLRVAVWLHFRSISAATLPRSWMHWKRKTAKRQITGWLIPLSATY